jgi:DNA modification methylase
MIFGGDPECDHLWEEHIQPAANGILHAGGMSGESLSGTSATRKPKISSFCDKCGAWFGQLGLEPTPRLYVKHIVEIFEECRRVLRSDGTCWVNLGDAYSSNPSKGGSGPGSKSGAHQTYARNKLIPRGSGRWGGGNNHVPGLKEKDLIGLPWRVAFALQEAGWWLRSDVIWSKPNPMPESVKDRLSRSHEYLFLLTKSKRYWYDADSIRQPVAPSTIARLKRANSGKKSHAPGQVSHSGICGPWTGGKFNREPSGANARTVWTIATKPYAGAHFATFPKELPRRCILAGCPGGGIVLDPFAGSGTTGEVAKELGRNSILIELNPEYLPLIQKRLGIRPDEDLSEVA